MVITVLALVLGVGAMTASAQTSITLGFGTGDSVIFTSNGNGSSASVKAGSCSVGGNCISGQTAGMSPNGTSAVGKYYALDFTPASITVTKVGSGFTLSQSGSIAFTLGTASGGSDLLTGTLTLVSFGTVASTGVFNDDFVANLVITGGTWASQYSPAGGIIQLVIKVTSGQVTTLMGQPLGTTMTAAYSKGSLDPTPEPASMLLFGTGILLIGGIVRRRLV
jgi:hypothetical protein